VFSAIRSAPHPFKYLFLETLKRDKKF